MKTELATAEVIRRFWSRVAIGGRHECWNWTAGTTGGGYGQVTIGSRSTGSRTTAQAHRFSYELLVGPIPEGLYLDHLCRNRKCVNPAHLEPVSNGENMRRQVNANASKTHCVRGHEFTPENTSSPGSHPQYRVCLACRRIRAREYRRIAREGRQP